MILRIYRRQVRAKLKKFPAVALTGPRQCGKTTLAQQLGGVYFDMETATSWISFSTWAPTAGPLRSS